MKLLYCKSDAVVVGTSVNDDDSLFVGVNWWYVMIVFLITNDY